ncbi:hypothetical protein [Streptomyces sp. NPDC059262]|uniref:hypothetical protein n=1 Tax=Streptomyces sp. NPDC059262 TaxID=3346797 RepID=UPI0036C08ED3
MAGRTQRATAGVDPVVGYGGQGGSTREELNAATDPFVLLGITASATHRLLMGTHILIAPLCPPVSRRGR